MVTGGQFERVERGYYHVPKRDLMVQLEVMIEQGELRIARELALAETLRKELRDVRVKVTASGHEQYGAWREGEHDDLVFAVALACWGAKRRYPGKLVGREAYWV